MTPELKVLFWGKAVLTIVQKMVKYLKPDSTEEILQVFIHLAP